MSGGLGQAALTRMWALRIGGHRADLSAMTMEWHVREADSQDYFRARLAQEVEEVDREVHRVHAMQLSRAADAAVWAMSSHSASGHQGA